MDLDDYKARYAPPAEDFPGVDAITAALSRLYPDQVPAHWGTAVKRHQGGPDPLDGVSVYESRAGGVAHLHFCTYGYSDLYYNEEAFGKDFSRYGIETTFRLASPLSASAEETVWVVDLLQNLSRYVFDSGRWFEPYHWLPCNGPIWREADTDIVGVIFVEDPELPAIDTPHGRVEFLQVFGITRQELAALKAGEETSEQIVERNRATNPLLITDLARRGA